MSAPTITISETSHRILQALTDQSGQAMANVIERALLAYQRQAFFEQMNAGYAELQADKNANAELQAKCNLWNTTLMDGLEPRERWTESGCCLTPDHEGDSHG